MLLGWLLCFVAVAQAYRSRGPLDTVAEWTYLDYDWPNSTFRQEVIDAGKYDPTQITPIDVERWRGRTFITAINSGKTPATVATVSDKIGDGGPLLKPYPDWSWYLKSDCDAIKSVYRVFVDKCNRLWILDTGKVGEEQTCPAKLVVFNLYTDKFVKKIVIPNEYSQSPKTKVGLLVTPIVETYGPTCDKFYVYMADVEGKGLVATDGTKFWRLNGPIYDADPGYENFTIQNESFVLDDGTVPMALQESLRGENILWFRSLSSTAINSVPTSEIKRAQVNDQNIAYRRAENFLPSQAGAMDISMSGTLFYVLTTETAIGCYNVYRPLNRENTAIVAKNPTTLQFASGLKVISSRHTGRLDEEVWILTNRLQKIYNGSMDFKNDKNFRILRASVRRLVGNSICRRPRF